MVMINTRTYVVVFNCEPVHALLLIQVHTATHELHELHTWIEVIQHIWSVFMCLLELSVCVCVYRQCINKHIVCSSWGSSEHRCCRFSGFRSAGAGHTAVCTVLLSQP